jgi:iron(III) transport system substrate-binding protein
VKRLSFAILSVFAIGCSSREVLVVYSPHGPDVLKDYKALFEAKYPEIEVQALDAGAQEVYSRIEAERNRPQADVWWGAPSTMFMQAADEGLLEAYKPSWAGIIEPAYRDSQDRWYGTYRSPLAILFNNRHYKMEDVPQTWDALLDPRWKAKITLRKPLASGTMRTFIAAMIKRAPSEDEGIAWLRTLHGQVESYMENPQLLYDHVKKREELVSVWLMPDIVLQRERNGYPFDYVIPPQTPVLTEGIAIVKGAPHPEWAKKFYELVTTPEALAQQAKAYGKVPVRPDVDPKTLPEWMAGLHIDPMPIDWAEFAQNDKRWCDRWGKEVYSK